MFECSCNSTVLFWDTKLHFITGDILHGISNSMQLAHELECSPIEGITVDQTAEKQEFYYLAKQRFLIVLLASMKKQADCNMQMTR